MSLISIVIPTRNGSGKLSYVLPHYKRQTSTNFEIVIANDNDAESDEWEQTESVAQKNGCPTTSSGGNGAANARNMGADLADGKYLLFIGDDCIPDMSLIQQYQHYLISNPDTEAVQGFTPFHPSVMDSYFMTFLDGAGLQANWYSLLDEAGDWKSDATGFCLTTNYLIKRDTFLDVGGFDDKFSGAAWEDVEFGNRLASKGIHTAFVPEATTYHWHKYKFTQYVNRQLAEGRNRITFATIRPEVSNGLLDINGIKKAVSEYGSKLEITNRCINLIRSANDLKNERTAINDYLKSALSLFSFFGVLEAILDTPYMVLTECNSSMSPVHVASAVKSMEMGNYAYAQQCCGWLKQAEGNSNNSNAFLAFVYNYFGEKEKANEVMSSIFITNKWIVYVKECINE